ncbi:unnamed protein product [Adineta ricciae]|uniref:MULE transposase domain-containing protein n=1 Tax=Adineta ricciae TaxID=249248 RepID=A0A814TZJ3_ADIRI|nr:unnamed protein product [Adineta ricciae]
MTTPCSTYSFINSNKGKPLLVVDDYVFQQSGKSTTTTTYWACQFKGCSAVAHTSTGTGILIKQKNDHCHPSVPEKIEIRKLMNKVKSRIACETTAIGQIYDQEMAKANLSTTALVMAPTAIEARAGLNLQRRKAIPALPVSIDFYIPRCYKVALNGERFLLADHVWHADAGISKRIVIFATDEQLKFLFKCTHILMDGTFSTSPKHFTQVYSIHGLKYKQSFLCVIVLMTERKAFSYKHMFRVLRSNAVRLQLGFEPTKITTDFESALINVIKAEFPNAQHKGCYFHYTNAIHRRIQTLGLSTVYKTEHDARSSARKLMALALLPLNQVKLAFDDIVEGAPDSIDDLIDYFRDYWMKNMNLSLWNVADLDVRTNNHVEGWNNRFNKRMNKTHPNMWAFIACLQAEEVIFRQLFLKFKAGAQKKIMLKTLTMQKHIDNLNTRFNNNEIDRVELLDGLSLLVASKK